MLRFMKQALLNQVESMRVQSLIFEIDTNRTGVSVGDHGFLFIYLFIYLFIRIQLHVIDTVIF